MFNKKTIKDIDLSGKQVVLRLDWNVPATEDGAVVDDFRIRASLPTLNYLLDQGCSVVVLSHRGRPDGPSQQLSLKAVAAKAGEIIGKPVNFVDDLVDQPARQAVASLKPGDILVLENTRFYPQEKANDQLFAEKLASYGEVFVFDAFAVAHRSDASTVGINKFLPSVAGFLVEDEITELSKAINDPKKPLLAITGGAKLETKLPLLHNLMQLADNIVVAGVMANILLYAGGNKVGKSAFDRTELPTAKQILDEVEDSEVKFVLPTSDVAVGKSLDDPARREIDLTDIADDDLILDFGEQSIAQVTQLIAQANTIIWNGPLGYYENPLFAKGSEIVAKAIADSSARSIVGGGDTAEVVNSLGLADKFTHVSTGGGASLDFMSGKKLPGVEALIDR